MDFDDLGARLGGYRLILQGISVTENENGMTGTMQVQIHTSELSYKVVVMPW